MSSGAAPFLMFFYGTLKRGERNHDAFCRDATSVEEATVRGRLYDLPAGYPAMIVPEEDIRAVGTSDPLRDAARGGRLTTEDPTTNNPAVSGELFCFDDPAKRLPALDTLEGFVPGDLSSPYHRVLIPVFTADNPARLAWTYIVNEVLGSHLPAGRWPARRDPR